MANELTMSGALVINNAADMKASVGKSFNALPGNCTTGQIVQGNVSVGTASVALSLGGVVSPQFGLFINNDTAATIAILDHSQGNATITQVAPLSASGPIQLRGSFNPYLSASTLGTTGANFEYLISGL